MSQSFRYDPYDPDASFARVSRHHARRNDRRGKAREKSTRLEEFSAGASEQEAHDVYDAYGDYDYSNTPYARMSVMT